MECSSAQTNSRNDTAYPVSGYAWRYPLNIMLKKTGIDAGDHGGASLGASRMGIEVSPYDMSFNTVDATVERPFLYSSHDHHWLRGYTPPRIIIGLPCRTRVRRGRAQPSADAARRQRGPRVR